MKVGLGLDDWVIGSSIVVKSYKMTHNCSFPGHDFSSISARQHFMPPTVHEFGVTEPRAHFSEVVFDAVLAAYWSFRLCKTEAVLSTVQQAARVMAVIVRLYRPGINVVLHHFPSLPADRIYAPGLSLFPVSSGPCPAAAARSPPPPRTVGVESPVGVQY